MSPLVGTPIWRACANVSTRLKAEVLLVIGGTIVAAGEYSVFIDLKENNSGGTIALVWERMMASVPFKTGT